MVRPAVTFEPVPLAAPDALPRMDVAAFVGFAEAGPVDVPVAVEDMARFRAVFGPDPELAFDTSRGEVHRGYLGAAVESFLASGGRRCWVVRVADDPELAVLDVPGLARLTDPRAPIEVPPAHAYARSPGVWANGLQIHATLREAPLLANAPAGGRALELAEVAGSHELRVHVVQPPGAVTVGDMLRVTVTGTDLQLFLVTTSVEPGNRELVIKSTDWLVARPTVESAPADRAFRSPALETADPALLDDGPSSPWSQPDPRVDRLTLDLSVWRGKDALGRVERLAFSPRHPRFWGNLPTDVDLYWRREPAQRSDAREGELAGLWDEAAGRRASAGAASAMRFALAGPEPTAFAARAWPLYVPSAMSTRPTPDRATLSRVVPDRVSRSGLEALRAEMFLDERLRNQGGESLLRSAELLQGEAWDQDRRATLRGGPEPRADRPPLQPEGRAPLPERLRGLHALLTVEEATLVAVPDAVHPGWSRNPGALPPLLAGPVLVDAHRSSAGDELCIAWTPVAEANAYRLQVAVAADFEPAEATHIVEGEAGPSGERTSCVPWPEDCEAFLHVRLHALRDGAPSPWSNTLLAGTDPGGFLECARLEQEADLLAALEPPAAGAATRVLRWAARDGAPMPAGASFEVESAGDPLFLTGVTPFAVAGRELPLPASADGPTYWRVRLAAPRATRAPWSNTVEYVAPSLTRPVLDALRVSGGRLRFDSSVLSSVHRSLLRFCHARGDLLGLLTLPRRFGYLDVTDHLAALTPDESVTVPALAPAAATGVSAERPLRLAEAVVLSYGALYHPWVAHRAGAHGRVQELRFIPADGVAAGQLARTALERGAWIAAANQVLTAVLATEPPLPAAQVDALLELQVNLVARTAPGFVLLDDQTLSRDSDTRPISVRRLLILLKRLALREGASLVFEPNDVDLQERVLTDFERVLSGLHQRGAFAGTEPEDAYRVVADATVNPPQSVDLGRFVVELRVAPSQPLKFLRVRLVQSGPQQIAVGEG
jgi:hypothetical protein